MEEGGSALPIWLLTPPFWKSEGTQTEWITGSREWWEANVWMNLIETHLWRTPPSPVWTSDLFMRLRGHMLQCKGQKTPCSSQRRHSWYTLCAYEYAGNILNKQRRFWCPYPMGIYYTQAMGKESCLARKQCNSLHSSHDNTNTASDVVHYYNTHACLIILYSYTGIFFITFMKFVNVEPTQTVCNVTWVEKGHRKGKLTVWRKEEVQTLPISYA